MGAYDHALLMLHSAQPLKIKVINGVCVCGGGYRSYLILAKASVVPFHHLLRSRQTPTATIQQSQSRRGCVFQIVGLLKTINHGHLLQIQTLKTINMCTTVYTTYRCGQTYKSFSYCERAPPVDPETKKRFMCKLQRGERRECVYNIE